MTIAKITGQGLSAIAILVALLWGCLIGERVIVQQANVEVVRTMRDLRLMRLRRFAQPVSVPFNRAPRPAHPVMG